MPETKHCNDFQNEYTTPMRDDLVAHKTNEKKQRELKWKLSIYFSLRKMFNRIFENKTKLRSAEKYDAGEMGRRTHERSSWLAWLWCVRWLVRWRMKNKFELVERNWNTKLNRAHVRYINRQCHHIYILCDTCVYSMFVYSRFARFTRRANERSNGRTGPYTLCLLAQNWFRSFGVFFLIRSEFRLLFSPFSRTRKPFTQFNTKLERPHSD